MLKRDLEWERKVECNLKGHTKSTRLFLCCVVCLYRDIKRRGSDVMRKAFLLNVSFQRKGTSKEPKYACTSHNEVLTGCFIWC